MNGRKALEFEQKSCANKDSTQTFPDHQLSKWMMMILFSEEVCQSDHLFKKKFEGLANI